MCIRDRDDRGIEGVSRFLNRFWNLVMDSKDKDVKETKEMVKLRHKLVYDIEQRFNQFSLNTVISGFMEYNNKLKMCIRDSRMQFLLYTITMMTRITRMYMKPW